MTFKLLATDLDGTLLDRDGRVHAEDREALIELKRRGVPVTICTGRLFTGSRAIARDVVIDGPIACTDGSDIVHATGEHGLVRHPVGVDTLHQIQDVLSSPNCVYVFARDRVYYDDRGEELLDFVRIWSGEHIHVGCARELSALEVADDVSGIVSLGDETWALEANEALKEQSGGKLQSAVFPTRRPEYQGLWALFTRVSGPSKATALEWIANEHGVGMDEVVAVGDWYNDLPMMHAAGLSFAMRQAPEGVRAAADEVLEADSTAGGGVAEAARRAGLL